MKRIYFIMVCLLSTCPVTEAIAAPPAYRRLTGGPSSEPNSNTNPGSSGGGNSGSINRPYNPPSGAGAAQPILGIIKKTAKALKKRDDLMDEFLDNPNHGKDPQQAWEQMIGGSDIPSDFHPLLTWGPSDTELVMEGRLSALLNVIYQQEEDYLKQLKRYLEENKQYITGHFTTNQGSNYYIITTLEGPRIIRIREDGFASMSSVYIFVSPEPYAAYAKAHKEWQKGGDKGDFVIPVKGSLAPQPGDTLIEWILGPTPDKRAPVELRPSEKPGYVTITVPKDPQINKDLKQHYSHPIDEVLE